MRILSHHFISRFLGLFVMVLAVAFVLIACVEFVLNLPDLSALGEAGVDLAQAATETPSPPDSASSAAVSNWASSSGHSGLTAFRNLGLRLASYYLADLLPIASFIAGFLTFALAGRSLELLATEAGGIPTFRLVLPVLASALILSLGTAVLHETVVLRAEQISSGQLDPNRGGIDFGRTAFWHQRGRAITKIAHADPDTRSLHGVEIFERGPDGDIIRVIRAETVRITESGTWEIPSADLWRFDPSSITSPPVLEREVVLSLDLDSLGGDDLLGANPSLLPLPALARYLESAASENSNVLRRARNRYQERRAQPWRVFVFALVAIPIALRVGGQRGIALPAAHAAGALALYFLFESAGRTLALEAVLTKELSALVPWLPVAAFGLIGLFLLARRLTAVSAHQGP